MKVIINLHSFKVLIQTIPGGVWDDVWILPLLLPLVAALHPGLGGSAQEVHCLPLLDLQDFWRFWRMTTRNSLSFTSRPSGDSGGWAQEGHCLPLLDILEILEARDVNSCQHANNVGVKNPILGKIFATFMLFCWESE